MSEKCLYKVTIPYREPVFEKYRGLPKRIYTIDYEVAAKNKKEAISKALGLFSEYKYRSTVSWDPVPYESKITVEFLRDVVEK